MLLKNLIGRAISQATMLKYILQLHEALAPREDQAIKLLLASPAMNVDETSMRVEKSKHWVHVYSAGDITLKRLHPGRGKEAIDEINIIPRYGGVVVHDCGHPTSATRNRLIPCVDHTGCVSWNL